MLVNTLAVVTVFIKSTQTATIVTKSILIVILKKILWRIRTQIYCCLDETTYILPQNQNL